MKSPKIRLYLSNYAMLSFKFMLDSCNKVNYYFPTADYHGVIIRLLQHPTLTFLHFIRTSALQRHIDSDACLISIPHTVCL